MHFPSLLYLSPAFIISYTLELLYLSLLSAGRGSPYKFLIGFRTKGEVEVLILLLWCGLGDRDVRSTTRSSLIQSRDPLPQAGKEWTNLLQSPRGDLGDNVLGPIIK